MKLTPAFGKTRASLLLLALITGVVGCGKDSTDDSQAAAESNSAGFAYVTSQDAGVSVIDLATMEVVKQFDVKAAGPRGLSL
ncbi:MAG TPA: hypothetical protein VK999_06575, partial [Methylotenera sp.]|nr:hypothetical protein [Methylotenera sp.]